MECKCGGSTVIREVVRDKKKAGEYYYCTACQRISWLWKTPELESEIEADSWGLKND